MVPGRAGFAPKAGADRAAARMMLVAIAINLDCRIIFSSKQLDAQRAMHVIPRAETSFFRAARVPLRHSMKEIPIQPRNSTVRCKLLYYSAYFLSRRGCTTLRHSRRSDVRTCNVPTLLFTKACRLFALFCGLSPFVFNGLQPFFAKHPGGGVCPQTRQLKSMGSSLLLLLRASRACSVLNSWLSCPEAGQP